MKRLHTTQLTLMTGIALFGTSSVFAGNITWKTDNATGLSWNNEANWSGGAKPGPEDTAIFAWENNKPNGPYYVLLDASQVIRQLEQSAWRNLPDPFYIGTEHDRAAGHTLTLSSIYRGGNTSNNPNVLADIVLSGDTTANIARGYNGVFTLRGGVSGPFGLTKTGDGTLIVCDENTYTGPTVVSAGVLQFGNGESGNVQIAGSIENNASLVVNPSAGITTILHDLSGTGSVEKRGRGILVFGGQTTATGTFTLTQHVWNNYSAGDIDCVVPGGATMAFSNYNLKYNFAFVGTEDLDFGPGTVTLVNFDGNDSSRTIDVRAGTLTFGGPLADTSSKRFNFGKNGAGTLVLKSASAYAGTTTVGAGTLRLEGAATIGAGALTVNGPGRLVLDNTAAAVDRVPDANVVTLGGPVALVGNDAADTEEAFGALTLATGLVDFDVQPGTSANASLAFASLAARNAGNASLFRLPAGAAVAFGAVPSVSDYGAFAAIDGVGADGTTGAAVLRGGMVVGASGNGFATIGSDGSVRVLDAATEQTSTYADGTDNVRLNLSGDITLAAAAMNTLELCNNSGASVTVTLGGTVTPQNGILFSGTSPIVLTGGAINANADNANGEAILLSVNTAGVTVETPVTGKNITLGGTGDVTLAGNLAAAGNGDGYITIASTGDTTWAQKNTGCGALRLYAGTTTLATGARLYEANSNGSGTRCYLTLNTFATLDLNGVSARANGLAGTGTLTNGSDDTATLTLHWSPAGSNWQDYTPAFNGTLSGNVALSVSSDGYYANKYTQTIAGSHSQSGTTKVSSGPAFVIASKDAFGTGALDLGSGARINCAKDVGGLSTATPQTWRNFTFLGECNFSLGDGPVTLANAGTTVTVNANTLSVEGAIGETNEGSNLSKAGTGTLVLNGANTYTGTTTVSAGTLAIGGSPAAPLAVSVAEGATLRLDPFVQLDGKATLDIADGASVVLHNRDVQGISRLVVNGVEQEAAGSYGAVGSGATHELPCFAGYGVLAFLHTPTVVVFR